MNASRNGGIFMSCLSADLNVFEFPLDHGIQKTSF